MRRGVSDIDFEGVLDGGVLGVSILTRFGVELQHPTAVFTLCYMWSSETRLLAGDNTVRTTAALFVVVL